MPRHPVSNEDWVRSKRDNLLAFLIDICTKYESVLNKEVTDPLKEFCIELRADETRKAVVFSRLARKNLAESTDATQSCIQAAGTFWEKSRDEKTQGYVEAVDYLRTIHKKFGDFIEYLDDNQDTVLPDMEKLAGYTTLFFGEFIKNT